MLLSSVSNVMGFEQNLSMASFTPFIASMLSCARSWISSVTGNNRLLVSFTDGMLHVVAAEQDRLLFANSFPAADLATAEYFIFSVTKEVLFNPEHTVLNIYGNVEENVKTGLGKYFASVKIIS